MTKHDFIQRVLLVLNEAAMSDAAGDFYIGADTAQVDKHIEGSFIAAWRRCANVMPSAWFENKKFDTSGGNHTADLAQGTGRVVVPSDFYRLSRFKMKGWVKPVVEVSLESERVLSIETNEWTRGSEVRPVCVIGKGMVGDEVRDVMTYYSLPKGLQAHVIEDALYIPIPRDLKDVGLSEVIKIDGRVSEPLAYLSGSAVSALLGKTETATLLEQRAMEMMPALRSGRGTYKQ